MDDHARLKYAFLAGAADAGRTLEETQETLQTWVKQGWLEGPGRVGYNAYLAMLLGSFGVGGLAGYAGRSIAAGSDKSIDEMKKQEMSHVYRTFAQRVRQRKKMRDLRSGNLPELMSDQTKEQDMQNTGSRSADYIPLF